MGLLGMLGTWAFGASSGREPAALLLLGLDGGGKSSVLNALRPKELRVPHVAPTVAQEREAVHSGGVAFDAWDVSGAARHRPLWERHFRRADALLFVVDAADHLRLVVAREELQLVEAHPALGKRVPLLVLANKADLPHAMAPDALAKALQLERVTSRAWHVCATDALTGAGLDEGVAWLARQLNDKALAKR